MQVLNPRVGAIEHENVSIRANTLQNVPSGGLVDSNGVAGQGDISDSSRQLPKIVEGPRSWNAGRSRRRIVLLATD